MSDTAVNDAGTSSPTVVEDWDNDDGESMQKNLEQRLKQVKILQREKNDKNARMQLAKAEVAAKAESIACGSEPAAVFVPPAKMQILRRPKSGDQLKEDEERVRKEQEERTNSKPTLEQRQAAYDEARNRILGLDYKPEPAAVPVTTSPAVSRNKSPEPIRVRRQSPEFGAPPSMSQPLMGPHPNYMMQPHMVYSPMGQQPPPFMQPPHLAGAPPPPSQHLFHVDVSRPPPPPPLISSVSMTMSAGGGPSSASPQHFNSVAPIAHYPPTGQYFTARPTPQAISVPYGHPPTAIYPPGTLGACMQLQSSLPLSNGQQQGQSQAQRKQQQNQRGGGGKGKKARQSGSSTSNPSS